jgi:hypothetical protein
MEKLYREKRRDGGNHPAANLPDSFEQVALREASSLSLLENIVNESLILESES